MSDLAGRKRPADSAGPSGAGGGNRPSPTATSQREGRRDSVLGRLWDALRPFDPFRSVKATLATLVIISVGITTFLIFVAFHAAIELRVIAILAVIASLLVTQFVGHGLVGPLNELTVAARAMARGDYARRVRFDRRDELGELGATFNRMAADLESVDRHRKELVANVSHELRTPIAGLRAVLENVVDGVSDADPETMRTALRQTERLSRLVEHLLDLSRLDNGVVPLHARRFEVWPYLSNVLRDANTAKGPAHSRTDVHLHLDVHPSDLTGHADVERLHHVVANLIDNAVKHSPPHGRVTVRARGSDQPQGLMLEVLDEGPGIPECDRDRVFERFGRAATASHGKDGGTGLGLAIAHWAVELHGGRIRVAESPRGCRMQVTLPGLGSLPD